MKAFFEKIKSIPPQVRRFISLLACETAVIICGIICFRLIIEEINMRAYYCNMSLFCIICVIFVMLVATGLLKAFGSAFMYCIKDEADINTVQMKKAACSIKLSMITAVCTGFFFGIAEIIAILFHAAGNKPMTWDLAFAYPCLDMWYGIIAVLLLLPVYAQITLKLLEKEKER